ncbi:SDR family oxidoreductase [Mucilaginibacter flavidus]|uniref:SDR family oxidoreductase n=1 Tax=Mucilaginibacter flavidus TaxID=2949309 RepID=UPI0020927368|nr:SDR family oxidoreductase [Mucilaginibacter flavidus]MCO5948954.1 SDR family oxidoreductase [Mucilaginibacter flavidus]
MVISILGCGWYGKALAKTLLANGFIVKGSATSAEKAALLPDAGISPFLIDFKADSQTYNPDFFNCDVLIVCIPPKTRQGGGGDYLPKIGSIISAAKKQGGNKVIYISSTAVYGDNNTELTELNPPEPDTESGKILLEAEKLFSDQAAFKTTILRFAGLVGPGRHPGRFFAGKTDVPNGLAPVNLIHLNDCIGITTAIIDQNAFGRVFNGVSPHHPTKSAFYREASLQAGLAAPEFINQLDSWKLIDSLNVPDILSYNFVVPDWNSCTFD